MKRSLLWLCLLLLTTAGPAAANGMPVAALPADAGGTLRPAGDTAIAVLRERLTLDLRESPGRITATYELQNRGSSPETVTVAFLAPKGSGVPEPPAVLLDGKALPVAQGIQPLPPNQGETALSPEWLDPFTGEAYIPGGRSRPAGVGEAWFFPLTLAPGQTGRLEVAYRQPPGRDFTRFVDRSLRYDYLLLPARHWAGFGRLEVEVLAPARRALAANLPLTQAGPSRYAGSFDRLPEANLSVFIAPGSGSGTLTSRWWQRAYRPWLVLGLTFALALATGLAGRLVRPAWQPYLALARWAVPVLAVALSPLYQFSPGPASLVTTLILYYPALLVAFGVGGWALPWFFLGD